jgi:hypothetical protein
MFDRKKFIRAWECSGLTKVEFAYVLGIARPTLYDWMSTGSPNERFLLPVITKACDALLLAVEKNLLPLPRSLSKEARQAKLAKMAEKLQSIPAAPRA